MEKSTNARMSHRITSGIQWGLTSLLLLTIIASLLLISISGLPVHLLYYGGALASFIVGFSWIDYRYNGFGDQGRHETRVEYLFYIALIGVFYMYVVPPIMGALEIEFFRGVYLTQTVSLSSVIGFVSPPILAYVFAYVFQIRAYHKIFD